MIASPTVDMNASRAESFRIQLIRSPLFRGLPPAALEEIVKMAQPRTRAMGTLLVSQGEGGDALFVIAAGRAKVVLFGESGREVTLSTLSAGDFVGEMAMLSSVPRSANVIALEPLTVLAFGRELFEPMLRRHPQIAINLLQVMVERLRRADETIASLALQDVEARLTRTLERLAEEGGERTDSGVYLPRRPTQQELANMVGSCRETISRTFSSMVRRGLLVQRGRGVVLTRELLARRAA